jgi:excisionase family DNA binding protein
MDNASPDTDIFLDVQDCARILRMSAKFIYEKLKSGEGPRYKKFGNRYRIRRSELIKWATGPDKRKS